MKNRKGFTLIELIAVIVILGLIILIAVPFFQGSMDTFREDYYSTLEKDIISSTKEFFSDNRIFLPNRVLDTQKIDLNTLINEKYLEDVKDYNGNSCDLTNSYSIITKTESNDYEYSICLRCDGDDYENTESVYCGEAWDPKKGFTKVVFDNPQPVSVFIHTPREELKELIKVYPDIIRCAGNPSDPDQVCDEEVMRVSATSSSGLNPIYPVDVDNVNSDVIGEYTVHYRYDLKTGSQIGEGNELPKGTVNVYATSLNIPASCGNGTLTSDIKISKENDVYDTGHDDLGANNERVSIITPYDATSSTDWAKRMIFEFSHTFPDEVTSSYNGASLTISRYQWFINNRWEDLCIPGVDSEDPNSSIPNYCKKTVDREMNLNTKFRYIDSMGNVSEESSLCRIRIDRQNPYACTLKLSGSEIVNGWYTGNVTVTVDRKEDQVTHYSPYVGAPDVSSGIPSYPGAYGVSTGTKANMHASDTQSGDVTEIVWYGYVEDYTKNYSTCSTTFKKDATKPDCTITNHSTLTCSDPTSGLVRVTFSKTQGNTTDTSFALNPNPFTSTWTTTGNVTSKGKWYLRAVDDAGNVQEISDDYYLVTYNANGGTGLTKTSEIVRKGNAADLTPTAKKNGYSFVGWSTVSNATAKINSHSVVADVTLYAVFKECGTGYYSNNSLTCAQCPAGYRDGTAVGNKTSQSACLRSVAAGYYIKNARDTTNTVCGNGYYKGAHGVTYGSTSSCTQCPAGYRNGTAVGNKTSQGNCIRSVAAGHYIATAYATTNTACAKGYYKTAHDVKYGATSACTSCGSGKTTDGTGSTSASACKNDDCKQYTGCQRNPNSPPWACVSTTCGGPAHGGYYAGWICQKPC